MSHYYQVNKSIILTSVVGRSRTASPAEESKVLSRIAVMIICFGIGLIIGLIHLCCRLQRNTETMPSQPVVRQSNSNAFRCRPVYHPPPPTTRTNHYQACYIQPPQPASNVPSMTDASVLPPSYDEVCGKQPPYIQAAY